MQRNSRKRAMPHHSHACGFAASVGGDRALFYLVSGDSSDSGGAGSIWYVLVPRLTSTGSSKARYLASVPPCDAAKSKYSLLNWTTRVAFFTCSAVTVESCHRCSL